MAPEKDLFRALKIGSGEIKYILQRKNMKNLRIRIVSGNIVVSCGKTVPQWKIDEFISNHLQWIEKTKKKILQNKKGVLPELFEEGETFQFLGRQIRIKPCLSNKKHAFIKDGNLVLPVIKNDYETRKKAFEKWLAETAKRIFEERYNFVYAKFLQEIKFKPQLKLRRMKSRWGSANINKRIVTLNTALLFSTVYCIDYVIAHEFTHFIHANHSKDFYSRLCLNMPDWKQRKKILHGKYLLVT